MARANYRPCPSLKLNILSNSYFSRYIINGIFGRSTLLNTGTICILHVPYHLLTLIFGHVVWLPWWWFYAVKWCQSNSIAAIEADVMNSISKSLCFKILAYSVVAYSVDSVVKGARWPSGSALDLRPPGRWFESHQRLLCRPTNANSACHPSGVG